MTADLTDEFDRDEFDAPVIKFEADEILVGDAVYASITHARASDAEYRVTAGVLATADDITSHDGTVSGFDREYKTDAAFDRFRDLCDAELEVSFR